MLGLTATLTYSSVAAAAAALGALPFLRREQVPSAWLGWGNAVAAGLMLGAAEVLSRTGLSVAPLAAAAGAILGVGFTYWSQYLSRTADLDLNRTVDTTAKYVRSVVMRSALHSAAEGVAIGGSMMVAPSLGVFMALALAVHNVPEGMALTAVLRGRGVGVRGAAAWCVVVNLTQVVLAGAVYFLASLWPALLPVVLGFAAGALVYLVMVELIPDSYRQAGRTSIAVLTSLAIGAVVLLESLVGGR